MNIQFIKHKKGIAILLISIISILSLTGCGSGVAKASEKSTTTEKNAATITPEVAETETSQNTLSGKLKVTYIDVGQGDAILVELPNNDTMLIDAGNPNDATEVVSYIQNEGYNDIDYLVATHPHSDHIGGMPEVIKSLDIGLIYMPKVSTTTNVFENMISAIEDKGLKIKTAKAGVNIINESNLTVDIISPAGTSYSDLNNYSTVIKLVYGSTSFLFMGDAEKLVENEITADVDVDILKVGHHGSDYSSDQRFIKAVSPDYAIISVGAGNQYGHPCDETLATLKSASTKTYRTDLSGTIVVSSDGTNISVNKTASIYSGNAIAPVVVPSANTQASSESQVTQQTTVYVTNTGTKYHNAGCSYLKSNNSIILSEAKAKGLMPCSRCNPPQ